jgi:hypothetical protein
VTADEYLLSILRREAVNTGPYSPVRSVQGSGDFAGSWLAERPVSGPAFQSCGVSDLTLSKDDRAEANCSALSIVELLLSRLHTIVIVARSRP